MTTNRNQHKALNERLKQIFRGNEVLIKERLAILRKAISSNDAGMPQPSERNEATAAAHKLAGSLGMFGLFEASALASEIEQRLERHTEGEPIELRSLLESLERFMQKEFRR